MKPQILAPAGFLIAVAIAYFFGINGTFEATNPAEDFLEIRQILQTGGFWPLGVFAALLCKADVFRHWIRRSSDSDERKYLPLEAIASSLSSGIAVAYVFLHLLPQLSHSHPDLKAIDPYIILLGFLVFYGMERLAIKLAIPSQSSESELVKKTAIAKSFFGLEVAFLCAYNALIIYTMPMLLADDLTSSIVYMVAMLVHLLRGDRFLRDKYPKQFRAWGRHALVATAIIGAVASFFIPPDAVISDLSIAALAGCTLLHIFKDELPDRSGSSYRCFLTGAVFLGSLMFFVH